MSRCKKLNKVWDVTLIYNKVQLEEHFQKTLLVEWLPMTTRPQTSSKNTLTLTKNKENCHKTKKYRGVVNAPIKFYQELKSRSLIGRRHRPKVRLRLFSGTTSYIWTVSTKIHLNSKETTTTTKPRMAYQKNKAQDRVTRTCLLGMESNPYFIYDESQNLYWLIPVF